MKNTKQKEREVDIDTQDDIVIEESNLHESCEQRLAEMELKYKRALADYQNLVRQSRQDRQDYVQYANQNLIEELLPLIDGLEMAASHLDDAGLKMVVGQFSQFLEQKGLATIAPEQGIAFDESVADCIETVPVEEGFEENMVAALHTKGYRWVDGNVVRHAKVTVYKNPS